MLGDVLKLVSKGWAVFPLTPGTKIPFKGSRGYKSATKDAEKVRAWWSRFPSANIGIACGLSRVIVVDVDVKDGAPGQESWSKLCDKYHLGDIETVTASTPSGGTHLYFWAPKGVDIPNSAGKLGPGLDVRGYNGYVVSAPSVIPQGRYAWDRQCTTIAPFPEVLIELLETPETASYGSPKTPQIGNLSRYVQGVITAEAGTVARAAKGTRNHTLNRAAFALGTLIGSSWAGLDQVTAEGALLQAAFACGLPEREAIRTIASGLQAGARRPRPAPGGVG